METKTLPNTIHILCLFMFILCIKELTFLCVEYLVWFLVIGLKLVSIYDVWIQYRFMLFNTLYSRHYVPSWHTTLEVWSPNENAVCVLSFLKNQIDLESINPLWLVQIREWLVIVNHISVNNFLFFFSISYINLVAGV